MGKQNLRARFPVRPEDKAFYTRPDATTNYEAGLAYTLDPKRKLYTMMATNMFGEPKFYSEVNPKTQIKTEGGYREGLPVKAGNQDAELLALIKSFAVHDLEFLMQAAAYARNELHLRTIPVVAWVEAAMARPKMDNHLIRAYAPAILKRADEPAEAIAYFIAKNMSYLGDGGREPNLATKGVMLPHSMKKGIRDAIAKNFTPYQIAKYDRVNAPVKWRDVINLTHPDPFMRTPDNEGNYVDTFDKVLKGTLEPAETWEDTLMTWRQSDFRSKREAWESIIPKMGMMALLRNLRNMVDENVDPDIIQNEVVSKFRSPQRIKNSKQFPYRWYSAFHALQDRAKQGNHQARVLMGAVADALELSVQENLPRWKGRTFIASDFSGSMDNNKVSAKSDITLREVAALFLSMAERLCEGRAITSIFGEFFKVVGTGEHHGSVLQNMANLVQDRSVGTATYGWQSIAYMLKNRIKVDRFVLFSDMQLYDRGEADLTQVRGDFTPEAIMERPGYNGSVTYEWPGMDYSAKHRYAEHIAPLWNQYKQQVNPDAYLYSVDLAGYGTSQFPMDTHNLCILGGYSDRILEFVPLFEENKVDAINKIRAVKPQTYLRKTEQQQQEEEGVSHTPDE